MQVPQAHPSVIMQLVEILHNTEEGDSHSTTQHYTELRCLQKPPLRNSCNQVMPKVAQLPDAVMERLAPRLRLLRLYQHSVLNGEQGDACIPKLNVYLKKFRHNLGLYLLA